MCVFWVLSAFCKGVLLVGFAVVVVIHPHHLPPRLKAKEGSELDRERERGVKRSEEE